MILPVEAPFTVSGGPRHGEVFDSFEAYILEVLKTIEFEAGTALQVMEITGDREYVREAMSEVSGLALRLRLDIALQVPAARPKHDNPPDLLEELGL